MKERVDTYNARSGQAYRPAPWIKVLGRPLGEDEACPTLFRYPCPAGLRDFQQGQLRRLAGGGYSNRVFLSSSVDGIDVPGREHFGCLVILTPLAYGPVRLDDPQRPHHWLAENRVITEDMGITWVPPAVSDAIGSWDELVTVDDVIETVGAGFLDEAKRETWDGLSRYIEELSAMAASGAEGSRGPWCGVKADERRALLERYGVRPLWTR